MSKYCFISVMGTQIMGTINPLLSLLEDGFDIACVHLLVSDDVLEVSTHFEEFCKSSLKLKTEIELISMPPYPDGLNPLAHEAALKTAKEATERGEQCIFNLDGSTNQMIASCCLTIAPLKPLWIQSTHNRFLLNNNGKLRQCRAAPVLKAQDILDLQGAKLQDFSNKSDECSIINFCKNERISLPQNALIKKQFGEIHFGVIWTESNNRLALLISCLQQDLPNESHLRLAYERNLTHWAAGKDRSLHLFDRTVYALVDNQNTAEHLESESNGKIEIVDVKGWIWNKDKLSDELKKLFTTKNINPPQDIQAKKRTAIELEPDTLIVAMSKPPSSTLLVISSHQPKNVVLCHTQDLTKESSLLREKCHELGVEKVRLVPCEFEGYDLLRCFAKPKNTENIYVNASPGTKGQGAYLTLWAKQANCAVWAIQPQTQTLERLDAKDKSIPLKASDPLLLLTVRGERMSCDIEEQAQYIHRNTALLGFLRTALGHNRENDIFRESVRIDDIVLHRPAKKDWELRLPNGVIYPFSLKGGEWLELLTAHAFSEAGASFAHARVRNLGSEAREEATIKRNGLDAKPHLTDIDVLGSYGGGHFLVSCKSNPKIPIQETVQEAHNMAKAVDRFTVALVCHLGCNKAYFDEKFSVMVFGWRELCQPHILKGYLEQLRMKFDTYKVNSNIG